MPKCKVCGFRLGNEMKKCPMCGAAAGSTKAGDIAKSANLPRYFCPSCKAEIIGEHRYCPSCMKELCEAAKQADEQEPGGTQCIQCGAPLPANAKFCHECGAKKECDCPQCGALLQPNAKFCSNCGAKQNSLPNAKPTKDNAINASGGKKETPLEAFEYEVRNGKYILKGLKDTSLTDVVIPRVFSEIWGEVDMGYHEENRITYTFLSAFYPYRGKLKSVAIPDTITKIGAGAFCFCSGLANIIIPNSVTEIGAGAFARCSGLANIIIPNSVVEIETGTFIRCESLTDITIPNSVSKIGDWAFAFCKSSTDAMIPNSVTRIGDYAFAECSSIANITIPNSVTVIGDRAFAQCSSLKNVSIETPNFKKSDIKRGFGDSPSFTEIKIGNRIVKVSDLD